MAVAERRWPGSSSANGQRQADEGDEKNPKKQRSILAHESYYSIHVVRETLMMACRARMSRNHSL